MRNYTHATEVGYVLDGVDIQIPLALDLFGKARNSLRSCLNDCERGTLTCSLLEYLLQDFRILLVTRTVCFEFPDLSLSPLAF